MLRAHGLKQRAPRSSARRVDSMMSGAGGVQAIIPGHAAPAKPAPPKLPKLAPVSNAPAFDAPRFIAVEGPLRVGKSTLAQILATECTRAAFGLRGQSIPRGFLSRKSGAAFRAQMFFLIERQRRLRDALVETSPETPADRWSLIICSRRTRFSRTSISTTLNCNFTNATTRRSPQDCARRPRDLPAGTPEVLQKRIARKRAPAEGRISRAYITEVVRAYEHFFFRYSASNLLVVNTSEIDFVDRNEDLQQLLRRLQEPVKARNISCRSLPAKRGNF